MASPKMSIRKTMMMAAKRLPERSGRRVCGRRLLPNHLPREEVIYEVTDEDRTCPSPVEIFAWTSARGTRVRLHDTAAQTRLNCWPGWKQQSNAEQKNDGNVLVEAALPTFPVLDSSLERDTRFLRHTENESSETPIEPQYAAIVSHDPACSVIHSAHRSGEYRRCYDLASRGKLPKNHENLSKIDLSGEKESLRWAVKKSRLVTCRE